MSDFIIKDGANGTNLGAGVTSENRLQTESVSLTEHQSRIQKGDAYTVCTGPITLTSANESAFFYCVNSTLYDMKIKAMYFSHEGSTGGSGHFRVALYGNPTAADPSTALTPMNANMGSAKSAGISAYKGAEADTKTGGDLGFCFLSDADDQTTRQIRSDFTFMLGSQKSFVIMVRPPTGNTSATCYFNMDFHIDL